MKQLCVQVILVTVLSTFITNCGKHTEEKYFIEAEINGVKWRGNQTGDGYDGGYCAVSGNNSKMKLWINASPGEVLQSFSFYSSPDSIAFPWVVYKDTIRYQWFIGAFDSKLKVRLNTFFEKDIDHFEFEKSANGIDFENFGSIPATGTSTTLKKYSLTLDNVIDLSDVGKLLYRVKSVTKSGKFIYGPVYCFFSVSHGGKVQIGLDKGDGKLYFATNNNQNQLTLNASIPNVDEKSGTFSFNYVDDTGDTIRVTNGKFLVK